MKKADVILKVLGAGLVKTEQCTEERERNQLPVNHCRSKEKNRERPSLTSLSMPGTLHQWAKDLTNLMPQEYRSLPKITDSRERES